MIRLQIRHKTGPVVLVIGLFVAIIVAIATVGQTILVPAPATTGVTAVATPAHDAWRADRFHCLIHGKYCVSDVLRGH
ncbi:conserved exported hypothetical protein [Paraburkholderia piptadeniae]|uniref:Uncharacterized protein n=1 Tax=Paraburkholderia piptadeniae TaxID=1701573 RepID=A0A1N7STE9_9BURK|nr:hypothetical protein [Paraburkholderia piptadeniae]SIT50743.1 conserved exported hypothetical protein [Paraburkholderia piptadeniae]